MGALFAMFLTGIVLKQPWWIALIAAMPGGALWGAMLGLFKALFTSMRLSPDMFN